MAKLLNVTFLALAYFFQFFIPYWEPGAKVDFRCKKLVDPPPNHFFALKTQNTRGAPGLAHGIHGSPPYMLFTRTTRWGLTYFLNSHPDKSRKMYGKPKKTKSMYEKAIFFFEIRKNPLKTGDFLKNLPRFSSKKIRAAAQKFPKTPSIQKNFPALGRCDDLVTGQCMAKLLNVTFLALAYFFQFYMAYWEHFTKRVFGSKSRKVGRTPPPTQLFHGPDQVYRAHG